MTVTALRAGEVKVYYCKILILYVKSCNMTCTYANKDVIILIITENVNDLSTPFKIQRLPGEINKKGNIKLYSVCIVLFVNLSI